MGEGIDPPGEISYRTLRISRFEGSEVNGVEYTFQHLGCIIFCEMLVENLVELRSDFGVGSCDAAVGEDLLVFIHDDYRL